MAITNAHTEASREDPVTAGREALERELYWSADPIPSDAGSCFMWKLCTRAMAVSIAFAIAGSIAMSRGAILISSGAMVRLSNRSICSAT